MIRRIIIALLALNILGFALFTFLRHGHSPTSASERAIEAIVQANEQQGVMAEADTRKLQSIAADEAKGTALTDTQVDWLLLRMANPLDPAKPDSAALAHVSAIAVILDAKSPTQSQKTKILAAVRPLLSSTDPNPEGHSSDKIWAATVVGAYGDRPSVGRLQPLLRDPDPLVHKAAASALQKMGFTVAK